MSVAEDISAILDLANRPTYLARVVVIEDGGDAAIVQCDPPGHWAGGVVLGQEIAPALEVAGFEVKLTERPLVSVVDLRPHQRHRPMAPLLHVRRAR